MISKARRRRRGVGIGKITASRLLEVLFQTWGWVMLSLEVRLTLGLLIEKERVSYRKGWIVFVVHQTGCFIMRQLKLHIF